MRLKTLKEFKRKLQEAMDSQDIDKFKDLLYFCPFRQFYWRDSTAHSYCPDCPLSDKEAPEELKVPWMDTCTLGSLKAAYSEYTLDITTKTSTLANLVLMSIKLLAYLDSKE